MFYELEIYSVEKKKSFKAFHIFVGTKDKPYYFHKTLKMGKVIFQG